MATISELKKIRAQLVEQAAIFRDALNNAERAGLNIDAFITEIDVTTVTDIRRRKIFNVICETTVDIDAVDE